MGRPFCENFSILVKCPRDSRKKSDWFRCKKISQKLKYLNFKYEQSNHYVLFVSPLCACPMRKILLATSEKREWKSGTKVVVNNKILNFGSRGSKNFYCLKTSLNDHKTNSNNFYDNFFSNVAFMKGCQKSLVDRHFPLSLNTIYNLTGVARGIRPPCPCLRFG